MSANHWDLTKENLYNYAVILMAGAIPTGNISITNLAIGVLLVAWIINIKKQNIKKDNDQKRAFILMLSFFMCYVVSLIYTSHIDAGVSQLEKHLSFLLFPLVLFTGPTISKDTAKKAIAAFSVVCISLLIYCLIYATWDYWHTGELTLIIGPTIYNKFLYYGLTRPVEGWHPVYVALYLVFIISFCWTQFRLSHHKRYLIVIGVCLVFLGLLQSVASFLVFSVVALYHVLVLDRRSIGKVVLAIALMLAISGIFFVNQNFYDKVERVLQNDISPDDGKHTRNSLTLRLAKWQAAISVIKDNALIGVSPGDLEDELAKKYDEFGYEYLKRERYNPHNQYLQILASFGIVGFVIFSALFFYSMRNAIATKDILFVSFLLMLMVSFLSESTLQRHQGIVFFAFFISLFSFQKRLS